MEISKTVGTIVAVLVAVIVVVVALVPVVNDYVDGRTLQVENDRTGMIPLSVTNLDDTVFTLTEHTILKNNEDVTTEYYNESDARAYFIADNFFVTLASAGYGTGDTRLTSLQVFADDVYLSAGAWIATLDTVVLSFNDGVLDVDVTYTNPETNPGLSAQIPYSQIYVRDSDGSYGYFSKSHMPHVDVGTEVIINTSSQASTSWKNGVAIAVLDGNQIVSSATTVEPPQALTLEGEPTLSDDGYSYTYDDVEIRFAAGFGNTFSISYMVAPIEYTVKDTSFSLMSVVPLMVLLAIVMGAVGFITLGRRDY